MYLLDTNILIWWLADDTRLDPNIADIIRGNICYVSSASIWEISIKCSLGKLSVPEDYVQQLEKEGFIKLPITHEQSQNILRLPDIHKDPFDRMLVSQAQLENFVLITSDKILSEYPCRTVLNRKL